MSVKNQGILLNLDEFREMYGKLLMYLSLLNGFRNMLKNEKKTNSANSFIFS